jgi:hypothetical protein
MFEDVNVLSSWEIIGPPGLLMRTSLLLVSFALQSPLEL